MLNLQEVPGRSWWDCAKPPLCHIGANPLTTSYFIHHRRQFVQQCRGINPGFSDGRPIFSFARQLHFPPIVHIAGFVGRRRKRGSDTPQPQPSSKKRKEVDYSPLLIPENSFIISHKNHCQCYYPRYSSGKMKIVAHLVKGEMKTIEKGKSCLSRVLRLLSGHINQESSTSPPENRRSWLSRPMPLHWLTGEINLILLPGKYWRRTLKPGYCVCRWEKMMVFPRSPNHLLFHKGPFADLPFGTISHRGHLVFSHLSIKGFHHI